MQKCKNIKIGITKKKAVTMHIGKEKILKTSNIEPVMISCDLFK